MRSQSREESTAVQNRDAGGQYAAIGEYVEFGTRIRPHPQFEAGPPPMADVLHPGALDQSPFAFVQFGGQAVQERHGIELSLVGQPDSAVERKGHVGVVDPFDIQARGLAGLQLGLGLRHPAG